MRGLACEQATLVSVRLRKAPLLKLGVGPCFLPQLARRAAGSYMHYLGLLMYWHDFFVRITPRAVASRCVSLTVMQVGRFLLASPIWITPVFVLLALFLFPLDPTLFYRMC